ncbi:oleate hydratase [Pseudomonas sp. ANT_J12]|uniref:oleate hydratase n=1 Tax=Pseudomonas sp. ANT_J12 TaxID=2597351 RepID=UPI0011F110F6|nr:oleate hydratase [Pseudomonas sp. ANT_J12]KAA0987300.1 oleate hydratase [Pseudomonas sp. ANT_J12]
MTDKDDSQTNVPSETEPRFYLVGGGIAAMAAAAFMIRDGDVMGRNITLFEKLDTPGGSLDGGGSAQDGYVLRGGRMFESKYVCTLELFASIPTLDGKTTVTQETLAWNERMHTSSKSRLARNGLRETAPEFGLTEGDILTIERIAIESEAALGRTTIADQFSESFFQTQFWLMWCTTFAFQPWHSAAEFRRYIVRFAHMVAGFNRLEGIMRTVYNQYDSLVRPLHKWLVEHGVVFEQGACVTDMHLREQSNGKSVKRILYERNGGQLVVDVRSFDYVLVTLGSMTEASSIGGMDQAPQLKSKAIKGAWALWETLAKGRPEFGHPQVFSNHIDATKWVSFTTTLSDPVFLRRTVEFTGNVPGEGGLITFPESNWLMSIVVPFQPHFIDQPEEVSVFWGYGLHVDVPGNFVNIPMSACTGREIMTELLGHLHFGSDSQAILKSAICIPCMMPFITSQFMPREEGDRPQVVPEGYKNLAFIGQYCELPNDVVFTVEYSIRTAQCAVSSLLGLKRKPPKVYKGATDPRVLFKAFKALHDMGV